jgi:hypothetical protein
MSFKPLDDRQSTNRSALSVSIGTSANATLDVIFSTIDSKMVNLNGVQTLTNKTINGNNNTLTVLAASQLSGVVPIVNGGTNNGSLPVTAGGIVYTDGTRLENTGAGTTGQVLTSNGAGEPTWVANVSTPIIAPPTGRTYLTSGPGTYNKNYTFIITSGNASQGATYTNNSVTFTVFQTVASATQVVMSGNGAPTSFGTLTLTSGSGDATITFSQVLAPLYIEVIMVGGGGGGGGSGTASGTAPTAGIATTFGTSLLSAGPGGAGTNSTDGGAGGTGGTSSLGTGPFGLALTGAQGGNGNAGDNTSFFTMGSYGGNSAFGGGGSNGPGNSSYTGGNATGNTGGGGGGASAPVTAGGLPGSGGGSGGYVKAIISGSTLGSTFSYVVGAGGTGGTSGGGAGGSSGGNGGSGVITLVEHYQ